MNVAIHVIIPHCHRNYEEDLSISKFQHQAPMWLKRFREDYHEKHGAYFSDKNDLEELSFKQVADILERSYQGDLYISKENL